MKKSGNGEVSKFNKLYRPVLDLFVYLFIPNQGDLTR